MGLQDAWKTAVAFHGCQCPALAIGTRATVYVMEQFSLEDSGRTRLCVRRRAFPAP